MENRKKKKRKEKNKKRKRNQSARVSVLNFSSKDNASVVLPQP